MLGRMIGMPKSKVTISVDPDRLEEARTLTGSPNTSATVDVALRRVIAFERARRDLVAYREIPQTPEEAGGDWADYSVIADDTDWDALYADRT